MFLKQGLQRFPWQFSCAVAGQCINKQQRTRQEDRVNVFTQRRQQMGCIHAWRHHACGKARDVIMAGFIRHVKSTIHHPGNGIEQVVEACQ